MDVHIGTIIGFDVSAKWKIELLAMKDLPTELAEYLASIGGRNGELLLTQFEQRRRTV